MSYIEPPTLSNIRKRKRRGRSASVASSVGSSRHHQQSALPTDIIDPHSYGPSARRQLTVAGLSYSDQLPGDYLADFPHRPLPDEFSIDPKAKAAAAEAKRRRAEDAFNDYNDFDSDDSLNSQTSQDSDSMHYYTTEDESGDGDPAKIEARKMRKLRRREAKRRRNAIRTHRIHDKHIGMLVGMIQRGLQEGDHGTTFKSTKKDASDESEKETVGLAHAKRAFALLVRTEIRGQKIDIRRNYIWAMGAEILMREGEDARPVEEGVRQRWGAADNIPQVRAFYENLIQLHPYNRLYPRSIGALTFWPIMIGTELYSIYAEAQVQTDRLVKEGSESGSESDSESDNSESGSDSDSNNDDSDSHTRRDRRAAEKQKQRLQRRRSDPIRLAREDIRLHALEQVGELARRMDGVMGNAPYSTSTEMLRLRGMLSLYMGDLHVVTPPCTDQEVEHGRVARTHEHKKARGWFGRLIDVDKDVQSGRQLSKKKGGSGLPDTAVDEYIRRMAAKKPSHSGGYGRNDRGDEDEEEEEEQEQEQEQDEGDDSGDEGDNDYDHEDSDDEQRNVFTSLPIRNM